MNVKRVYVVLALVFKLIWLMEINQHIEARIKLLAYKLYSRPLATQSNTNMNCY